MFTICVVRRPHLLDRQISIRSSRLYGLVAYEWTWEGTGRHGKLFPVPRESYGYLRDRHSSHSMLSCTPIPDSNPFPNALRRNIGAQIIVLGLVR